VGEIRRKAEALAIAEPDVVIGLALEKFDLFCSQGCTEIFEAFVEEVWEEEERRPLVETL